MDTKYIILFLILVDTFNFQETALQAMGLSAHYVPIILGFAIGVGIFLVAEYLPEIISKGKTLWQKATDYNTYFLQGLFHSVFMYLVFFRTTNILAANTVFGNGAGPTLLCMS